MRYLVFGDIHGNALALEAVLAAAETRDVGAYLCVGDVVGYGPRPLECLERVQALQRKGTLVWVAGNHELALRDEVDLTPYSPEALATLAWTRKRIESHRWAREFLATAEVSAQVNGTIWLTHDSLVDPSTGRYHREVHDAKRELICLWRREGRVAFYGHTHQMRAEVMRPGEVALVPMVAHAAAGIDPEPVVLATGERGWIGVGSVGFPTNPQRLAEFVILDDADRQAWRVEKYAVAYSREHAKQQVKTTIGAACGEEVAARIARWL
jgi:predicted phosphodiesterase